MLNNFSFSKDEVEAYDRLLNKPSNDWDVYYWMIGHKPVPDEYDNEIMKMLQQHCKCVVSESENACLNKVSAVLYTRSWFRFSCNSSIYNKQFQKMPELVGIITKLPHRLFSTHQNQVVVLFECEEILEIYLTSIYF